MAKGAKKGDDQETVGAGLRKAINSGGFGFQYAVLEMARFLNGARESSWVPQAAEFPVTARQKNTHIDFVLREYSTFDHVDAYLVAECKRENPATARWCFVRAPYSWQRNELGNIMVFEELQMMDQLLQAFHLSPQQERSQFHHCPDPF